MVLESGVYIISCRDTQSYVGRNAVADKALLARRIINLPRGVEAPRFIVEKSPQHKGCYIIRAVEGLVAEKDSLLWAFLIHAAPTLANMWHVNPQVQYGQNVYTVEKANGSACWVLPDKRPETQIVVKPLPARESPSFQHPPEALFEFIRIDRD